MASAGTVEIDFAAETAKFTAELRKVRGQLTDLQGTTKKIASGFEQAGKLITGVFAGLAVGRAISAVVQATSEAEEASAKLANALQGSGAAAELTVGQLKDYASQLQRTTTFGDEAVQEVEAMLLSFRNLSGGAVLRATAAVLDLSTRMKVDLRSAAVQVGKALDDPARGLTGLARSGVQLTPALQQTIALLIRTGQQAKAQALILDELEKTFGGTAAAARNTFGGALAAVKNAFGDLLEAPGGAPGATRALNELADTLGSPEMKEGMANLVTGLSKIVELTAIVASRGPNFISNAVSAVLVPGAGLNAVQLLERELDAQQQIVKQIENNRLISKETVDLEKARLETLKQRIALLKAANAEPIEPVRITQAQVAQGPADTSALDVARRKQQLDAALEATRATLKTTLNEFDALNAKADETQKRILEGSTQTILDGARAAQDQLNEQILRNTDLWIEQEDRKREATQRSLEARYDLEVEFAKQKRSLEEGAFAAGVGLLQAMSVKSKSAAKALVLLNRGVAIANVIQNTVSAASKALAIYGPTPAGYAAAGAVIAWGAAQVALLAKTASVELSSISSGNAGGIGGSNLGTPANPLPVTSDSSGAQQGRVIQVILQGPIAGPKASQWLIDSIRDLVNGNDTIIINGNSRQAAEIRGHV